ncbi:alpha/beta fold hydrolase [Streptomyces sp. NBC_01361]|uniref:alpha/beta fold hydrolase n=1 Tax=Streptomyces sp. NBC_01361 TaxID=2903838 RepID=UPI002E2FB5E0|nr:alpha/beta fold hydrolase [Streptomyces sp. NBC_01361]
MAVTLFAPAHRLLSRTLTPPWAAPPTATGTRPPRHERQVGHGPQATPEPLYLPLDDTRPAAPVWSPPQHLARRITLADGAETVTRVAVADDYDLVQDLHARCSAESRTLRYDLDRANLTRGQWEAMVTRPGSVSLVTCPQGRPDQVIALAHVLSMPTEQGTCELAFLIADAWQRRALGTGLGHLCAELARAAGYRTAYAYVARSNRPALSILRRLGPAADDGESPGTPTGPHLDIRIALQEDRQPMDTRCTTVTAHDGARLAVYLDGPDDAPATVLLAHGWCMTSSVWRRHTEKLANAGHRVVRVDWPGHGRSPLTADEISIDAMGRYLCDVLAEVAPNGPVVLGGHSLGGMALMALAAVAPDIIDARVTGVVLCSTSAEAVTLRRGNRPGDVLLAGVRAVIAGTLTALPGLADRVRRRLPPTHPYVLDLSTPHTTASSAPSSRTALHHTPTRKVGAIWKALRSHHKSAADLSALAALGPAVHILTGAADTMIPARQTDALASLLPGATVHAPIPRCDHLLPVRQPALVTQLLDRLCAVAGGARVLASVR